jgi:hypothetical protein
MDSNTIIQYLIKQYYYNPGNAANTVMKDFWVSTVQSTIKHIALHPYDHPELTYLSQGDVSGNLEWQMDDYVSIADHLRELSLLTKLIRLALQAETFCWEVFSSTNQKLPNSESTSQIHAITSTIRPGLASDHYVS